MLVHEPSGIRDDQLVERMAEGDAESLAELFDRYAPSALALARRILGQHHLAEETVQEAFLALWRDPDRYTTERGSVRSWLMSIVHHRAVDVVRREGTQVRRAHLVAMAFTESGSDDPGTTVVERIGRSEEQVTARRALACLPFGQRQIIELMYFEGLTQTQIAAHLSLPLGTVKSRTRLGMRRLRTSLDELNR